MASLSASTASKLELVETEIASTSAATVTAVDTTHRGTSAQLGLVSEEMHSRFNTLESLVTTQNERIDGLVISQQFSKVSGTRLLETAGVLRKACDFMDPPSTSAQPSRHRCIVSSRCGCDFWEKIGSMVASDLHIGEVVLFKESHESSRHAPSCPFYVPLKAQRRVGARFRAGVWSQLSVLVQASLACTTGAGGFSISPQLCFRMTVPSNSRAYRLILEAALPEATLCFLDPLRSLPDAELAQKTATIRRTILKMFQTGEASPNDQLPDGSNLLHVCCLIRQKHPPVSTDRTSRKQLFSLIFLLPLTAPYRAASLLVRFYASLRRWLTLVFHATRLILTGSKSIF